MNLTTRLTKHFAVAALATVAASSANAQIVYSGIVNHNIAATTNGLYVNVVNGMINEPGNGPGSSVPGWDLNFWSSTGFGLFNPSQPAGGVYVITSTGWAANMAYGTMIDGTDTYGSGTSSNISQWVLNSSNNLVGFRFLNEGTNTIHYGWARIAFGASITSRTLVEYAYDATAGTAIGAGVVPAPASLALLGLGGLVARRRR